MVSKQLLAANKTPFTFHHLSGLPRLQDWFMTLESTSFVAKESFSDRFEYLVRCGDLMLPLSDAEEQDSAVSEFKAKIKDESHEVTVLPPVVLGLGFAKLRHKLAALLHQFRLELGNDLDVIQAYCRSVLSICTDQGTEAGIFSVPSIDIHKHLINEAKALSSACPPGVLWALKDLVPAPGSGGHLQVGSGGDQLLPSDNDPGPVPSEMAMPDCRAAMMMSTSCTLQLRWFADCFPTLCIFQASSTRWTIVCTMCGAH